MNFIAASIRLLIGIIATSTYVISAFGADKVVLGVVSRGAPLQWPLYVGIEKGFFADAKIELDVVAAQSSAGVVLQLASGSINMGTPSSADGFRAISKGAPIILFRTDLERAPFMLMSKPEIKHIGQLRGKTISVGSMQGIDRFYLDHQLARQGLKPSEYDVISAGSTPARYAALVSGAVQAAVLTAPQYFPAQSAGYNNLGPVEYDIRLPFTNYGAYKPWADNNRDTIIRFAAAYTKAVNWFNNPANRSGAIETLVKWGKGDPVAVAMTYDVYLEQQYFKPEGRFGASELAVFISILKQLNYLEGETHSARFFDDSILSAATR